MGNTSTTEQWAGRERLHFIERLAWWRGVVNRADLRDVFRISSAQASGDLQGYLEINPGSMVYNMSSKRYEARPDMTCVLHKPMLEEAVRLFMGGGGPLPPEHFLPGETDMVDCFVPPGRRASQAVERRVFLAVIGGCRLRVKYWSVAGNRGSRREIAPHAFGNDGYRWHVRAWCFEKEEFRDFVLSRIEEAEWPIDDFEPPVADVDWTRQETVVVTANPALDEAQRKSIERDYGMRGGKLAIKVRGAMRDYLLAHLRLNAKGDRPQQLALLE